MNHFSVANKVWRHGRGLESSAESHPVTNAVCVSLLPVGLFFPLTEKAAAAFC